MLTIAASRWTLVASGSDNLNFQTRDHPCCVRTLATALSSATLETLTKLVSLKERNELTKGKQSDTKRYIFADKVVPYHFWTGIA